MNKINIPIWFPLRRMYAIQISKVEYIGHRGKNGAIITPKDPSIKPFNICANSVHNYNPSAGGYWMEHITGNGDWFWGAKQFEEQWISADQIINKLHKEDNAGPPIINAKGMKLYQENKSLYGIHVKIISPAPTNKHLQGARYIVHPINDETFHFVICTDGGILSNGKDYFVYRYADKVAYYAMAPGFMNSFCTPIENIEYHNPHNVKVIAPLYEEKYNVPHVAEIPQQSPMEDLSFRRKLVLNEIERIKSEIGKNQEFIMLFQKQNNELMGSIENQYLELENISNKLIEKK